MGVTLRVIVAIVRVGCGLMRGGRRRSDVVDCKMKMRDGGNCGGGTMEGTMEGIRPDQFTTPYDNSYVNHYTENTVLAHTHIPIHPRRW